MMASAVLADSSAGLLAMLPALRGTPAIRAAVPRWSCRCLYASSVAGGKEKVVIIGSGWAGINVAKRLDKSKYDLSVVSPVNHFVFTPLLASTAVGTLEYRNVTEPVKTQARGATYFEASADSIDLQKQQVHCTSEVFGETKKYSLNYDRLVIACGGVINTFGTPGVEEFGTFLKTVRDARTIRARIIECFDAASAPGVTPEERKQLLHFAVVGGGPTGVEFAAELKDFVETDAMRIYPDLAPEVKISIYDVAPVILAALDRQLVDYVMKRYAARGICIRTGTIIKEVRKKHLVLKDQPDEPYGLLVWSTGVTQRPLITGLDVSKDRTRRLLTDTELRVLDKEGKALRNVYALGDCATVKDNDLPPTAQVAKQKAIYLVNALNRVASASNPAFVYHHRGTMAYVGGWRAVVQLQNFKLAGFLGFLMWRGAYLNMAMSVKNKIMLPINWVLSWLCGRDISRYP